MKKLNFISPINKLSYGYCGYYILRELIKSGLDIAFFPIGNQADLDNPQDINWINDVINKGKFIGGYKDTPSIKLWHQFDINMVFI